VEGSGCWDLLRRFGSLHLVGPPDREQAGKRPQYRPGATEAHFEDADSEKPGLRKSECEVPPQITPDNQQSLKSCALWPASLQTAAQFPKLLHQGEPAVQRLRSRREGWVKKQFVCANVVASRNVFFDLVDCAGKNHSLVAGRLLTNFQVGPHDHGQRQRILENGCIEIAASLASLSNHKCGVIFCIAIFTFIYQDGEVPLSLVNCMANTFAKRSVE